MGSAALVEALQVLDAVKKNQPVVAAELPAELPKDPKPAPQQASTKAEEKEEEDEFAYFKDYE
ncbi:MAG: hypothetical protein LBV76_02645 [Deltaproteobacteria bacterium]|nr:hypothetical protein [Deltaproteobacteria bacterium]